MEPINLFSNSDNTENISTCSICYNNLIDNKYKLQDCNHEFHSDCIITWFRLGKSSCPLCRNNNSPYSRYCPVPKEDEIFKMILNYSKKKTANKEVVKIIDKYKNIKKRYINSQKENKNYRKQFEEENKKIVSEYKKIRKIYCKKQWQLSREERTLKIKLRKIKEEICSIPIIPLKLK